MSEEGMEEDVVTTTDVPQDQQSHADLLKMQKQCIAAMRRKMPSFAVHEPVVVYLEDETGRSLAYVSYPDGPIRFNTSYYERCKLSNVKSLRRTMMHELLHLHLYKTNVKEPSHGPTFRKLAVFFGLKGWGDKSWRWQYKCPVCKYWTKEHERRSKLPVCMGAHFYGEAPHAPTKMKETQIVKLAPEERAALAGKEVASKPAKPKPTKAQVRLAKLNADKERLARLRTRIKALSTRAKKLERSIGARERHVLADAFHETKNGTG